ncbi:MAG: peptide chain release factor N(5)-glutamine methyltransferase [Bacilli bacterium]|nr:peptide chain release factor N(5)-glutamine methyltransferase [Bacilli bacterium]
MRVEDLIVYGKSKVHSEHAKMLLAALLNVNSLELLNYLDKEVPEDVEKAFKEKIAELVKNRPIQYVIGNVSFYGEEFLVNESTLIPRFETEELVENVMIYLDEFFDHKDLNVVDLGTGTGCIGLTLKKLIPSLTMTLVDISDNALEMARKNQEAKGLDVSIIKSNFLEEVPGTFDIIVSNPPYIKEGEEIEEIVKENEPSIALYAGHDGLDSYRTILHQCKGKLNPKFMIAFEIGCDQREALVNLIHQELGDVRVICKKDLSNRDRMIFIFSK